jgi:O-antigen/teichoic acid export membrane protein
METDSIEIKIGKAFFWNSLLLPISGVASFLGLIFIARFLSLHDFGIYAIINSIITLCIGYGDLGVSTGASKFFPEVAVREGKRGVSHLLKYLLQIKCGMGLLTLFILLLFAKIFSSWFKMDETYLFAFPYMGIIVFLDSFYYLFHNLLWAIFEQKKANLLTFGFTLLQPLLIILFILWGWEIRGILIGMTISSFLRAGGFFFIGILKIRNMEEVEQKVSPEGGNWPKFFRVSLFGYFDKVSNYFFSIPFITLLLALYLGKDDVALFSLAGELTLRFLSLSLTPTHGWILPLFSTVFASKVEDRIRATFSNTLKIVTLLSIPIGTFLYVFAHPLILHLYSEKYSAAVPIAKILIVFYFLEYTVLAVANATLIAGEKLKTYFWIKAIFFLSIPLYFLVIPLGGLTGTAYFYGVVRLLVAASLILAVLNLFRFGFPFEFYGKAILSAGIVAGLSEISISILGSIILQNLFWISMEGIGFLFIYYLTIKGLRLFGEDEKELLIKMKIPYIHKLLRWV